MGKLLTSFNKLVVENIIDSISSNTSRYYAFAANPVLRTGNTPATDNDDYSNIHESNWYLLFGKRLTTSDVLPMTRRVEWTTNTVYTQYDDTANNMANSDFYVMVPADPGEYRHVYKCIYNANGVSSTDVPNLQQADSFTQADGYIWRYLYSISDSNYNKFSTDDYIPVTPNTTIQAGANSHTGLEVIVITNPGNNYISYHDGVVRSVVNSTLIQIESDASTDNGFYINNGIYIYNASTATSQLKVVADYVSNLSGNWVYLTEAANTTNITTGVTEYKISPQIVFDTDGTSEPYAYTSINATSNTIESVTIIDVGNDITRATATILSNTIYGEGATLQCIVAPPGGHGYDPSSELGLEGIGFAFSFSNTESNTISTEITYNRIGLYANPYTMGTDGAKGAVYSSSTFDQLLVGTIYPAVTFANNETVIGQDTGARGVIAFANSTDIYLVGDKEFSNGELIVSSNGDVSTTLTINSLGDIFVKDLMPFYTQNIDDVTRANNQSESFKIIIRT